MKRNNMNPVLHCALVLAALLAGVAHAASPWGTTWGESYDNVKARFADAEFLDTSTMEMCKGSAKNVCQQRQVILKRSVVGSIPSRVIFEFSPEAKLNSILVMVEDAHKYTPQHLGILFEQIKALLETEHGKPVGATEFTLVAVPSRAQKSNFDGRGTAAWHTEDSIVTVDLGVYGAESELTPTRTSTLFLRYGPLGLFSR